MAKQFRESEIQPPALLNDLFRDTTPLWSGVTYDSFLFHAVTDYVKRERPRLIFLGFGETDEWGHAGRYDQYLTAAHHMDDFVRRLWLTVQSMKQYRDKTTFVLISDHGRGSGPQAWRDHGETVAGAEANWMAIIGPDTPPAGERANTEPIATTQIAATVAMLLGEDFREAFPRSGAPVMQMLRSQTP